MKTPPPQKRVWPSTAEVGLKVLIVAGMLVTLSSCVLVAGSAVYVVLYMLDLV